MPGDFTHLIGGVKGPARYEDGFPPVSFSTARQFSGTVRSAYPTLARSQYQAHAGSCYPHTVTAVAEAEALSRGADVDLCRLDVYRGARWLEGNGAERIDGGCYTDEINRWCREFGTVLEARAPYNASLVTTWAPDPSWAADRALLSFDLQLIPVAADPILAELERGRCVSMTHLVYGQMADDPPSGVETGPDGGGILGGHARTFCGFDLDKSFAGFGTGGLLIRNSWRGWGLPHPQSATDSRFAGMLDSFSWLPLSVLNASRFIMDSSRLARGLAVKP